MQEVEASREIGPSSRRAILEDQLTASGMQRIKLAVETLRALDRENPRIADQPPWSKSLYSPADITRNITKHGIFGK